MSTFFGWIINLKDIFYEKVFFRNLKSYYNRKLLKFYPIKYLNFEKLSVKVLLNIMTFNVNLFTVNSAVKMQ